MKNLSIKLESFPFYEREKVNGEYVKNKCGRDFLYYAFCYYLPEKFGNTDDKVDALGLDKNKHLGLSVPAFLAWTQVQFYKIANFFKSERLSLNINKVKIDSFHNFVRAILFSRLSFGDAVEIIEKRIDNNQVVGIDIPLMFDGLLDHMMFVYGYDEDNYYIFDTRKIPFLDYEKITDDNRYIMKISKNEIQKKWARFGRVWEVSKD